MPTPLTLLAAAEQWLGNSGAELRRWRRDFHANPEVAWTEHRTTEQIMGLLAGFGLDPIRASAGTGVRCDIPSSARVSVEPRDLIALRADIDALPLSDIKQVDYASTVAGACHACGHDAHTAILLGVAAVLAQARQSGALSREVRLIFQPAEERTPSGAQALIADGVLDGVGAIFALHCDPRLDTGRVGLRAGAITAALAQLDVTLSGAGGHTARPHLTADIVFALGKVITELPGLLSRRIDPRSSLSLVWGAVAAGSVPNAIPAVGSVRGTLRMLDGRLWHDLEPIVADLLAGIVGPTGATLQLGWDPGTPAVVNDTELVNVQRWAALTALGDSGVADTAQSMGGEDFSWYLQGVPGAMARLGVRRPGSVVASDLHQPGFDIDENALPVGVRFTAALLDELSQPDRAAGTGA